MASWWAILAATRRQMGKDNISALAAGAAFQSLLSLFPTLTAVVSVYGLVADPNMVERQITAMQGMLPPEAVKLIATWLQALVQGPTTRFGIGLIVSVLLAFWSMWSATGMLMTAVNICYGEEEKRGFVSFNPNLFNPVRLGREDAYTCSLNRPNLEPALHRGELGSREDR
jgi:membrane protein